MANKVTIEVEAVFVDRITQGMQAAAKAAQQLDNALNSINKAGKGSKSNAFSGMEKSAESAKKKVESVKKAAESVGKTKADVKINAQDKATKALQKVEKLANTAGKTKADIKINAQDKASSKLAKLSATLKTATGKAYSLVVSAKDNASATLSKMSATLKTATGKAHNLLISAKDNAGPALVKIGSSLRSVTSKAWKVTVSLVDKVTSPIRSLKNALFSMQTLVAGVATGVAANAAIIDPVQYADTMETASIGFETMLKSNLASQRMMNEIKSFAKTTPFDTTGVVTAVQQMMRAGWTEDTVMRDIERIGNAAAAAGQGTAGVQGIVTALQQMKMSGRVYAQDMFQLTNRGVEAWQFLADGLGKTLPEVRKMAEEGEITADEAINHILNGMTKYDGMMDKMSNRTVGGILSNLKDTFDISFIEKWGKGLAEGATQGLGKFADWLEKIDPLLQKAGTSLQDLGKGVSTWAFDKLEAAGKKIIDVLQSPEFINAEGVTGKIGVLWDNLIVEPLKSAWNKGKEWLSGKADDIGAFLGEAASNLGKFIGNGITTLFGGEDLSGAGESIGRTFWEGFKSSFDGEGVKTAIGNAIKSVFGSASDLLPGGKAPSLASYAAGAAILYGGTKILGGLADIVSFGKAIGAGKVIKAGAKGVGKFGSFITGGTAAGLGTAGSIATGTSALVAAYGLYDIGTDVYDAFTTDNPYRKKEKTVSAVNKGAWLAGGAATGAMIGSVVPVVGTAAGALIGAGVGYLSGTVANSFATKNLREQADAYDQSKYATQQMKDAIVDADISTEELNETFKEACKINLQDHFGDIRLSASEVSDMAKQIVQGANADRLEKFSTAVADVDQSMSNLALSTNEMEKLNFKASLGTVFDDAGKTEFLNTVDQYTTDIMDSVSNQHYQVKAAVDLLLEPEQSANIMTGVNDYFTQVQSELSGLTADLKAQYSLALEDGVIDVDEQQIISSLQEQINGITGKLNNAKTEAKFEALKVKYSGAALDSSSFSALQSELATMVKEKVGDYDEALEIAITSLKLQFPEGGAEYNAQLEQLLQGYKLQIDGLRVQVMNFQLESIAAAFGNELEGILPDLEGTVSEKFAQVFNNALANGESPIKWSTDDIIDKFGLSELPAEIQTNVAGLLQNVAQSLPQMFSTYFNSDGTLKPEFRVEPECKVDEGTGEKVQEDIEESIKGSGESTVEKDVNVETNTKYETSENEPPPQPSIPDIPTQEKDVNVEMNTKYNTSETEAPPEPSIPDIPPVEKDVEIKTNPIVSLTTGKESFGQQMLNQLSSFGGFEGGGATITKYVTVNIVPTYSVSTETAPEFPAITGSTTANVSVAATYTVTPEPTFGPYTGNATASVAISATYTEVTRPTFGPYSASATAHVTITASYSVTNPNPNVSGMINAGGHAKGGFVKGRQLSWVGEEGPEAIIPLIPQRRARGLELWRKAGEALGVIENADGGIVGGEGRPAAASRNEVISSETQSSQAINIERVEIVVQGGSGDVAADLESQKEQIARTVAAILKRSVAANFANTPKRA